MTPPPPAGPAPVPWPIEGRPRLHLATHARLADRGFEVRYGPVAFHALHLHEYEARLRLGRIDMNLQPGDMTLTPAGVPSWYDLPEPGHHLVVHFQPMAPPATASRSSRVHLPLHLRLNQRRTFAWHQLAEIVHLSAQQHRRPMLETIAAQLFQGLLLWLAAEAGAERHNHTDNSGGNGHASAAVRWAAEMIEQKLHQPITVPRIANAVGLSQNYLARCFRQRFGMTIPRYVLTRRIAVARDLLTRTNLPISQIAARVGMPDPHHFNKQFRNITGTNPSAFRQDAR